MNSDRSGRVSDRITGSQENPLDDIQILQNKYNFLAIMKDDKFHKSPIGNGIDSATDSSATEEMIARMHRTEVR